MADGNGILALPDARGHTEFGIDLSTGLVHLTHRKPLDIQPTVITISILDFLDFAAQTTLELNKTQREAYAQMARVRAAGART